MHKTHSSFKYLSKPTISTSTLSQSQSSSISAINTSNKPVVIHNRRECVLFPTYAFKNPDDPNEWIVRTKGWALSLKKAGPKQKVLKGIAKSVAGSNAANEISNKMFENRFKYFLAKGKRNRQFRIEAAGTATCTDWHDQQEEFEQEDLSTSTSSSSSSSSAATTDPSTPQGYFSPRSAFIYSDNYCDASAENEQAYIRDHQQWNKVNDQSLEYQSIEPLANPTRPFPVIPNTSTSLKYTSSADNEEDEDDDEPEEDVSNDQALNPNPSNSFPSQKEGQCGVTLKSDGTGLFMGQFSIHDTQVRKWHSAESDDQQQQQQKSRIIRIKSEPTSANITDIKKDSVCNATFGIVNLVDSNGVSVISDIDDTIKDTRILAGARAVLKNTFYNPTRAVTGMADVYSHWYKHGASFHYVSNSPFQLVHMLYGFMSNHHFPPGSFHLRPSKSLFKNLVEKQGRSKRDSIVGIMRDFPQRKFVLVGDSGEIDLEIYTRIATEFPDQVLKIFIRDVTTVAAAKDNKKSTRKRFQKLSSKSASFPSFFISNSSSNKNNNSINLPHFKSTSDINTNINNGDEAKEENTTHDDEDDLPEAASKLAGMVLEPPLTGHQPIIQEDFPPGLAKLANAAAAHHQPHSNTILQLYSRLNQARKRLDNIDIVLFQDAKELYNDQDVRLALDTFKNEK